MLKILTILVLISGCALHRPVIVEPDDFRLLKSHQAQHEPTPDTYSVAPGDTLFSIAFRYGKSVEALARLNRIPPPYLIRPSQLIKIAEDLPSAAIIVPVSQNPPVLTEPPRSVSLKPLLEPVPAPVTTAKPALAPSAKLQPVRRPASIQAAVSRKAPARKVNQSTPKSLKKPAVQTVAPKAAISAWQWPSAGNVVGRFGSNGGLNKGVDIAGQFKEPIVAARGGVVVYAGSGLRGYGKLLIIKHDDIYLSAYAHSETLLVSEGSRVKQGQVIARMGSSGTDRVMLHFEVRKSGTPVDPLQFLPRR